MPFLIDFECFLVVGNSSIAGYRQASPRTVSLYSHPIVTRPNFFDSSCYIVSLVARRYHVYQRPTHIVKLKINSGGFAGFWHELNVKFICYRKTPLDLRRFIIPNRAFHANLSSYSAQKLDDEVIWDPDIWSG